MRRSTWFLLSVVLVTVVGCSSAPNATAPLGFMTTGDGGVCGRRIVPAAWLGVSIEVHVPKDQNDWHVNGVTATVRNEGPKPITITDGRVFPELLNEDGTLATGFKPGEASTHAQFATPWVVEPGRGAELSVDWPGPERCDEDRSPRTTGRFKVVPVTSIQVGSSAEMDVAGKPVEITYTCERDQQARLVC